MMSLLLLTIQNEYYLSKQGIFRGLGKVLSIYAKPSEFECQLQKDEHHSRSVRSAQTLMANSKCYLYTMNDLLRNDNGLTGIY